MMSCDSFKIDENGKILWISGREEGKEVDFKKWGEENKNSIVEARINSLPKGKTTPEGQYPKFKSDELCAYPERQDCNYGPGYCRCRYMTFLSPGNWYCDFKKENKNV